MGGYAGKTEPEPEGGQGVRKFFRMRVRGAWLAPVAACIGLALPTSPALGWGRTGHRVVGALAEKRLSPAARNGVRSILGSETLAEASTWPDDMRPDPGDFWQNVAGRWHNVTVPPGKSYDEAGAPAGGDAVTALDRFSAMVRDCAASTADRQLALRFIVHLVGDLHQPLHAYSGGPDRGGNAVKLRFLGRETTFHLLWDAGFIDEEQLAYSEWVAWLDPAITPDDAARWRSVDPRTWIAESVAIRDSLPPPAAEMGNPDLLMARPIIRRRLKQAGVRLAFYLDRLFADRKACPKRPVQQE